MQPFFSALGHAAPPALLRFAQCTQLVTLRLCHTSMMSFGIPCRRPRQVCPPGYLFYGSGPHLVVHAFAGCDGVAQPQCRPALGQLPHIASTGGQQTAAAAC